MELVENQIVGIIEVLVKMTDSIALRKEEDGIMIHIVPTIVTTMTVITTGRTIHLIFILIIQDITGI